MRYVIRYRNESQPFFLASPILKVYINTRKSSLEDAFDPLASNRSFSAAITAPHTHLCEVEAQLVPGGAGLLVAGEVVDLVVSVCHHVGGDCQVARQEPHDLRHLSLHKGSVLRYTHGYIST